MMMPASRTFTPPVRWAADVKHPASVLSAVILPTRSGHKLIYSSHIIKGGISDLNTGIITSFNTAFLQAP